MKANIRKRCTGTIADPTRKPKLEEHLKGVEKRMENDLKLARLVKKKLKNNDIDVWIGKYAVDGIEFRDILQYLVEESEK